MKKNRRRLAGLLVAVALFCFRSYWLPLAAVPLVVDQPASQARSVAILGGDAWYDFVARTVHQRQVTSVLLFEYQERWVNKVGARQRWHRLAQEQLQKRGVPEQQIVLLPKINRNGWDCGDRLAEWLQSHPKDQVIVTADRLRSREIDYILRHTLPDSVDDRVHVVALDNRLYDESNWWQSRTGWKELFNAYLGLAYTVLQGRPPVAEDDWDPDEYEREMKGAGGKEGGGGRVAGGGGKERKVAGGGWLSVMASWLEVGEHVAKANVVLALPGDEERRPFVAASLVKLGLVDRTVLVQNLPSPDEVDGVSTPSHVVMQRIYEARGVRPNQILLLSSQTTSTADDLAVLGRFLAEHPDQTACVVTNAFHTRRTRWTILNHLPQQAARIVVVSAPNPEFHDNDWWRSPDGMRSVSSEYAKLTWYWLRYGYGAVELGAGVAAVMLLVVWRRSRRPHNVSQGNTADGECSAKVA